MSKARNLAGFISDATVEAAEIADNAITNAKVAVNAIASENLIALNVTHDKLHTNMDLSTKTITLAADAISGNSVHSGTISDFASTGIDDNATSTVVTVASTGKVGVGATVPGNHLTVYAASATTLQLANATTTAGAGDGLLISQIGDNAVISNAEVGYLKLKTNGSDRLTITSAGDVLVGKTSQDSSLSGCELLNNGTAQFTRDGNSGLRINRLTSDGELLRLSKDGTAIGSINAENGNINIGSGDTGIRFDSANNTLIPVNMTTNGVQSGTTDLGSTNYKWKDLYLSGQVTASRVTASRFVDVGQPLDLTALSFNHFYPVILNGGTPNEANLIEVSKYYGNGGSTGTSGSAFTRFTHVGYSWGGNPIFNKADFIYSTYQCMIGAITLVGYYKPVIWLRGSYEYTLKTNSNITPDIVTVARNGNYGSPGSQYDYWLGPLTDADMQTKNAYLGTASTWQESIHTVNCGGWYS